MILSHKAVRPRIRSYRLVYFLPTGFSFSGRGLPLYLFEDILKTNAIVTVPAVNYDNNQHGENENVRLQNLWEGIETVAAVMEL